MNISRLFRYRVQFDHADGNKPIMSLLLFYFRVCELCCVFDVKGLELFLLLSTKLRILFSKEDLINLRDVCYRRK